VDELPLVASRAVHFAALALLFGAPFFRLAISPLGPARGWPGGRAIERAAAVVAVLSALGWFAGVAASMAGGWSDAFAPDTLWAVTFDTRFGRLWMARLAAMAAILAVLAWSRPAPAKDAGLVFLASAVGGSLVGTGHGTAGAGAVGPLHAVADVAHLLCAMGWIGGLACLAQVLRAGARGNLDAGVLRVVLRRFSRFGYWLVAVLLISGCINALVLLPRPDSLVTSAYGRVLVVKVGLALIMVAFAAYNRVVLAPHAVPAKAGAWNLWRSVVAEQGVGLLVLASAALLGTIHPVP
jgi:putative copper resistance protein D